MFKNKTATVGACNLEGQNQEMFKIHLQLFAEEPKDDPKEESKEPPKDESKEEPKAYSEEEVQKRVQSETDKRVTQALKTAQEKWEAEFKSKIEQERKEAERLAKLSGEEKEKELLEKAKKEIEERERALRLKELKLDAIDILTDKKLPVKFADMLLKDNAETTMENIKVFEKEWKEAIESAVNERLKGTTPKVGGSGGTEHNPWKQETLNFTEQGRILRNDPEKAKKLMAEAGK
jgi:hypothetical protein